MVFLFVHGAVEIIVSPAIAALTENALHVQGIQGDNRRSDIVKIEGIQPGKGSDFFTQRIAGQWAGGDDHRAIRNIGDFAVFHGDEGMVLQLVGNITGESFPVHRQRTAGGHPGEIGCFHDEGMAQAHFLFQKAHGIGETVRPEGIGAHQFGKQGAVMGRGHFFRLHFNQRYLNALQGQLPGGFAPGQPCADDSCMRHRAHSSVFS